jgi:Transposase IS66 family
MRTRREAVEHPFGTLTARMTAAIRYGLTRLKRLRPNLNDGRLSIENNAAERGTRSIVLGWKNIAHGIR